MIQLTRRMMIRARQEKLMELGAMWNIVEWVLVNQLDLMATLDLVHESIAECAEMSGWICVITICG
jgi:hypothetical protein